MSRKKWRISQFDKKLAANIAYEYGFDEFAVLLLISRGITDPEKIAEFFDNDISLSDPFSLKDMQKGADIIAETVESGEKITVYGDYDADGVTATAILYSYLQTVGANVDYYIPSRITEGYGMNKTAIKKLKENGTELIITVDNGISAVEETAYAKELGMKIVITDHHQPSDILPGADAVIDPYRQDDTSACKMLAGAGVAFKLVSALENGDCAGICDNFADLAAIGTVADIVPLKGENRKIVIYGLSVINENPGAGINALKKICGFEGKPFTATTLAFSVAPRINAAGRIETAETALKLLLCEDEDEAELLAKKLDECNIKRQQTESEIFDSAVKKIEDSPLIKNGRVIVVSGKDWHPGVIGIVASKLVEKYSKPAMVISETDGEEAKGSCRSVDGFSLFDALTQMKDYLIQFGGHILAAGFSIEKSKISSFRNAINQYALTLDKFVPSLHIDCKLNPPGINNALLESLELLEPFGADNPQPVFCISNLTVKSVKPLGVNGRHIRLQFERDKVQFWAVYFGISEEMFPYKPGEKTDIAVTVDKNEYRGEIRPNIRIRAVRPAGSNDDELFLSFELYEKASFTSLCSKKEIDFIRPDRNLAAAVFRSIKKYPLPVGEDEVLCSRLSLNSRDVCKIKVLLDAFCETGIIRQDGGFYTVCENTGKVSLENASILKKLGYTG